MGGMEFAVPVSLLLDFVLGEFLKLSFIRIWGTAHKKNQVGKILLTHKKTLGTTICINIKNVFLNMVSVHPTH